MALLQAMASLEEVFNRYAGKEGDNKTLTKEELGELLHKEMGIKGQCKELFQALDEDKSGVVDFKEYVTFVAALSLSMKECK